MMPRPWHISPQKELVIDDPDTLARALFFAQNKFVQCFRSKKEIREAKQIAKEWQRLMKKDLQ